MAATKESQAARILRLLKQNGYMTNRELNKICLRYSARIKELRDEGQPIVTVHDGGSLWRFVYKYQDGEKMPPQAVARLMGVPAEVAVYGFQRFAKALKGTKR